MFDYTLTRSKRKTLAVHIKDGAAEVRAPLRVSIKEIERFLTLNEAQINSALLKSAELLKTRQNFNLNLNYGAGVLYKGENYIITPNVSASNKKTSLSRINSNRFYIPQNLTPDEIKSACVKLYKKLAKADLTEKAYDLAKITGVLPASVKINGAKTRWGSCSSKKNINFSWRLIMADEDTIDYVVIHELAHLIEHNHSSKFWEIVKTILPDYKIRQRRLKALQEKLSAEDWD